MTRGGLVHFAGINPPGLNLSPTNITDAGMGHIGCLPNPTDFTLRETQATAAGITELPRAFPNGIIKKE